MSLFERSSFFILGKVISDSIIAITPLNKETITINRDKNWKGLFNLMFH